MNISVLGFACVVLLFIRCVHSEATNCIEMTRCPIPPQCYCYDGSRIKFLNCNGQMQQQNCDCPPLAVANVTYTPGSKDGHSYTVNTRAHWHTSSSSPAHDCYCRKRGWTGGQKYPHCAKLGVTPTTSPQSTTPTPTEIQTCAKLSEVNIPFVNISYRTPSEVNGGYRVGTYAYYKCYNGDTYVLSCTVNGWTWTDGVEHTAAACSCSSPENSFENLKVVFDSTVKTGRYRIGTTATWYCHNSDRSIGTVECTKSGRWTDLLELSIFNENCLIPTVRTKPAAQHSRYPPPSIKGTEAPLHHSDERTLVIVSGTTGAILGALIILVVVVSCQRRLHYHRLRRARLRHRQDQDAFTAFITYHRDVRLMLPSYDEAINQQENGQPPSFEEALSHYEEPSLPPRHTPASESPPSFTPRDTPTSTTSPVSSETRNSPEDDTGATLFDGQASASPAGNTRLIRSLRALFGGRAFRTDAIYCRFVPQEDENESDQNVERDSRNSAEGEDTDDAQLSEVLARAGLC